MTTFQSDLTAVLAKWRDSARDIVKNSPPPHEDASALRSCADELEEILRRHADALLGCVAAPDGHAIVPITPTPKMLDATWNHPVDQLGGMESLVTRNKRIWSAMLAAAQEGCRE